MDAGQVGLLPETVEQCLHILLAGDGEPNGANGEGKPGEAPEKIA